MKKYINFILQEKQDITPKITQNESNCGVNICPNIPLGQSLANYDPLAKCSPVPGFVFVHLASCSWFSQFKLAGKKFEGRIIFCDM